MAQQFEDLIAWQKARLLTVTVYQVTSATRLANDFGLRDQIRRAAVSVMSNIAEGSCGEVRSQLYIAHDVGYLDNAAFRSIHDQALEVSRIIGGLQASIKRQQKL